MRIPAEVKELAVILRRTKAPQPLIALGELALVARRTEIPSLQYNKESWELLKGSHDYKLNIAGVDVHLSAQLYFNVNEHFRLFAYARCGAASGMLFSLNMTTEKGADGIIGLSQRLRFAEGRGKTPAAARSIRQRKTLMLADILTRS
jgi:hypothetical protein